MPKAAKTTRNMLDNPGCGAGLEPELKTSFTFRITGTSCTDDPRVSAPQSGITREVKAAVGGGDSNSIDKAGNAPVATSAPHAGAIDKKRKELRALFRKIGSRKKTLEKLKKAATNANAQASVNGNRGSVKANTKCESNLKSTIEHIEVVESADSAEFNAMDDDVNTTFATEDLSIDSMTPLMDSTSSRKRRRFAGVWDDVDVYMEMTAAYIHAEKKRARMSTPEDNKEAKENIDIGPSSIRV